MTETPIDWFASYTDAMAASREALTQAQAIEAQLMAVEVTTAEQLQWAADAGRSVHTAAKNLEDQRDRAAKPWYQAYKAIRAEAAPAITILKKLKDHLGRTVTAFRAIEAAAQAKALAAAHVVGTAEAVRTVAAVTEAPSGAVERETWAWVMADGGEVPTSLAGGARGVPAEFWILDEAKLSRYSRAQKADLSIGGIKPVCTKSTHFRK
jgi:hypothetical protein